MNKEEKEKTLKTLETLCSHLMSSIETSEKLVSTKDIEAVDGQVPAMNIVEKIRLSAISLTAMKWRGEVAVEQLAKIKQDFPEVLEDESALDRINLVNDLVQSNKVAMFNVVDAMELLIDVLVNSYENDEELKREIDALFEGFDEVMNEIKLLARKIKEEIGYE